MSEIKIRYNISRLSEINCAETFIRLDKDLRDERSSIVNFLKIMEIIELDKNGGFHFIGEKSSEYKRFYLNCYKNY